MLGVSDARHVPPLPGSDCMVVTILGAPSDDKVVACRTADGQNGVLKFPGWCHYIMKDLQVLTIFNASITSGGHLSIDCDVDGAVVVPHVQGTGKIGEGFAGIGGWSQGLRLLGCSVTMAVESDLETAQAYGRTYGAEVLFVAEAVHRIQQGTFNSSNFVLVGDMLDPNVWMVGGFAGVTCWLVSPPCQPWSSAGNCLGLQATDGKTLTGTMMRAGQCGIRAVLLENVPNITKHEDFTRVKEEIAQAGFQLVIDKVDDVATFLPCRRKRWLAIFIAHSSVPSLSCLSSVSRFQWPPDANAPFGTKISLGAADAVHKNITHAELDELTPSDQLWKFAMDPELLPPWQRKPGLSTQDVIDLRVVKDTDIFKAIMASYGSQEHIPMHCLIKSGLHAFFVPSPPGSKEPFRLASPWEFLCALGFGKEVILPCNQAKAWKIAGNALAPMQAALACFRLAKILGTESPIVLSDCDPQDIVQGFLQGRMQLSRLIEKRDGEWRWLVPLDTLGLPDTCIDEDSIGIPPTVPFQVEDHMRDGVVTLFAHGQSIPDLQGTLDRFLEERGTIMHRQFGHIPWVVAHSHGHGVFAGWVMEHKLFLK